jgi:hypothetical protein
VPFALLVTGLIVGGLALLLLLNTASAANEVRRHDVTARDVSIAARVQALRNEVAASSAPGNLAAAAAALGMVPAINPAFLVVASGGAVRVLGSPAPASSIPLPQPTHPKKKKPASTKTATHTATSTATTTATSTGHGQTTAAGSHSSSPAAPSTPKPTPTPTPTLTIPGGNR